MHPSFGTIAGLYTNNTNFASLLQGLNTLSVRASHTRYGSTVTTTTTPNNDETEQLEVAVPPVLQAARQPPKPVNRLLPLPAANNQNEPLPSPPPLSNRGISRE